MELMRILLLCAVVATLPQALGANVKSTSEANNRMLVQNFNITHNRDKEILSYDALPLVSGITELQALFSDQLCKHCNDCIEKAVKTQQNRTHVLSNHHLEEFFYNIQETNQVKHKHHKRSINANYNNTEPHVKGIMSKPLSITKYTQEDQKVYAIKIVEVNQISELSDVKSTCKVYSVKKTLPCESDEIDLILTKRRVNKKGKKSKDRKYTTTEKARSITTVFKKREVRLENSHVPESFMPSIEELY